MISKNYIHFEKHEKLSIITIDNPPVNALNACVMEELNNVLSDLENSNDIHAVILTGAGQKAFVAGADISQFLELNEVTGKQLVTKGQGYINKFEELKMPVICAINGFALGAGCELALACDIRIAEVNAKLGLPEVGLGIIPGYGGTQRLSRLVGVGKAKELIFSGDPISAEEAYRIGLVEKIVPQGESLQSAKALAQKIMTRGPIAVSKAKEAIHKVYELPLKDGLKLEAKFSGDLYKTEDKNEGAQAFFEKRTPKFKGK